MASATVSHPAVTDRPRSEQTATPAPRQETYEQATARETKRILEISAVAVVLVLILFLGMMWVLSGHGAGDVESFLPAG